MVSYLLNGNKRLDMAIDFATSEAVDTTYCLDFSCGIGYFSENLLEKSPQCQGVAVDAGPANVRFARRLLQSHDIEVHEFDDLTESKISEFFNPIMGSSLFTSIFAIDVIEHLPPNLRQDFLSGLRKLVSNTGSFIITYPSPEYQRHLRREKPEELQYIDEEIPLERLLSEINTARWRLKAFRSADVWLSNQYYHLHLIPEIRLDPVTVSPKKSNIFRRISKKLTRTRRKRTVDNILSEIL